MALKPDTDDTRENRAIPAIEALIGGGLIIAYDPKAMNNFAIFRKLNTQTLLKM